MILVWLFVFGWRWLYSFIHPVTIEKKDVLVMGAGGYGKELCKLLANASSPYRVVGLLDDDLAMQGKAVVSPIVLGTTDQLLEVAEQKGVKTAILAITHDRPPGLVSRILDARLRGMNILEMPTLFEKLTGRVPVEHIHDGWLLFTDGFHMITRDYIQKIIRLIDLGVSGLLLLLISPFMALTVLAIKLESGGHVFFTQDRVGKGGKIFKVWKFRSMCKDAEANGAVWAKKSDPRVTWVGRWIRLFRIDELPQLYNVFYW